MPIVSVHETFENATEHVWCDSVDLARLPYAEPKPLE
jgi:hypothetical protein